MAGFNLKDYEEVKDRIPRFWAKHEDGAIVTSLEDHDGQEYIFKAALINGAGQVIATGWASEIVGSSNVNKTSALENCETSAIGRALANAGFSSGTNRPSREEMSKAARVDHSPGEAGGDRGSRPTSGRPAKTATEPAMKFLNTLVNQTEIPEGCPWPLTEADGKTWLQLPAADVSRWIDQLKELAKEPKAKRANTKEELKEVADRMRAESDAAAEEFVDEYDGRPF